MGVAPAADAGRSSSNPPGRHAGNLDNRELVAGSTLYIPVFVPGALFEVGDGHAAQAMAKSIKISMATDPDLTVATRGAIQEMIEFIVAEKQLTRYQAYQLVSVAGNVAVTQLVAKPNHGVQVRLPKSIFTK